MSTTSRQPSTAHWPWPLSPGIWLAGGGRLAAALRYEIDELVIKRNPIVLGAGTPLVAGSFAPQPFNRTSSRTFDTGVVVEVYRRAG